MTSVDVRASCKEKLDRAYLEIERIDREIAGLFDNGYAVKVRPEGQNIDHTRFTGNPLRDRPERILLELIVLKDPSSIGWGVRIGEAVHNLRSALEQIVWNLSLKYSPIPLTPYPRKRGDPWRDVAFPVALNCEMWRGALDRELALVKAQQAIVDAIHAVQPCRRTPSDPDRDALQMLQALWIEDKHRTLCPAYVYVGFGGIQDQGVASPIGKLWEASLGGVQNGAPLARYENIGGGTVEELRAYVSMKARLAISVAFEEGPPAFGSLVGPQLKELYNRAAEAVSALAIYL